MRFRKTPLANSYDAIITLKALEPRSTGQDGAHSELSTKEGYAMSLYKRKLENLKELAGLHECSHPAYFVALD